LRYPAFGNPGIHNELEEELEKVNVEKTLFVDTRNPGHKNSGTN